MEENSKLRLIKKPSELKNQSNFWRCCPLNKEYLPDNECPEGKLTSKGEEPPCKWWIASPEHNYCFWRYVKDKSDADGVMKELVQSELATLLGFSNTKTHFVLKQAMLELTEALKLYNAVELLQDSDTEELETTVILDDFLNPPDGIE